MTRARRPFLPARARLGTLIEGDRPDSWSEQPVARQHPLGLRVLGVGDGNVRAALSAAGDAGENGR